MPSNPRQTPAQPITVTREKSRSGGANRLHAVAAAVVLCTSLVPTGDAMALALGRIVVQSALGEPLRAEIEVPEISAEEASSLRVALATPAAFRAAGMDFNQALGSAQLTLERRPDGRAFLRLTSARPVNEPFVDLMVEASWASGRIVRDYTLLIDPPKARAAAPVAPMPAAVATQAARPPVAAAAQPLPPAATRAPAAQRAAATGPTQPARPTQLRVRAGDTAGRIADANRPAHVSLDQMLVAMLRANPSAFIGDNVNRIKAGAVIDLPAEAAAAEVPAGEASQIIAAQSRDFDEFRRRLAGRVPATAVDTAGREAAGRVQAEVQEQQAAPPVQDKLTLSKGAVAGAGAAEDKIAQERQAKEAATRVAELSRNVEELAKLGASPATAAPGAPAPAAPEGEAPGAAVTAPAAVPAALEAAPDTPALGETAAASPSPETATPPPAVEPTPAPPVVPAPVPIADEPSLLDQLQESPLLLPAAGGLLALLVAFGLYRMRQRRKGPTVDSSFLESRLQPDSFFGSSGGQRIDTADAAASGSSMVYSPSQLDAAGDVDPVAEADVYLAYGRDLQAEEILKEAMRSAPLRVAIHSKLLEIYAKRRDAKAFEVVATEAYSLTQGQGPEWDHACELGGELDPDNPLYQPGGAPAEKVVAFSAAGGALTQPFGISTLSFGSGSQDTGAGPHLDLDLSIDDSAAQSSASSADMMSALDDLGSTDALTRTPEIDLAALESRPMDFDLDFPSEPAPLLQDTPEMTSSAFASDQPMFDLSDSLSGLNFDAPQDFALPAAAADAPAESGLAAPETEPADLMPFDLSDANLDLDNTGSSADMGGALAEENPLDTKLSLAQEFRAIGDLEGARSLAEEVLAEASGALKTKASTFLADLG